MSCAHSETLTGELRALAAAALDRVGPLVDAVRAGEPAPSSCASCPVCALLAVLRGERPELAARLAEHAAGLLAVLRAAVDEVPEPGRTSGDPGGQGATPDAAAGGERRRARPGPARRVQHIRVVRP